MLWPRLLPFFALKGDATPPLLGMGDGKGVVWDVLGSFASQISLLAKLGAYFRATLANEKLFRVNFAAATRIQLGKWVKVGGGTGRTRRSWRIRSRRRSSRCR